MVLVLYLTVVTDCIDMGYAVCIFWVSVFTSGKTLHISSGKYWG